MRELSQWWMCSECAYTFQAAPPLPEACPGCDEKCAFVDATCYTPDCGGPDSGNLDPRVVLG